MSVHVTSWVLRHSEEKLGNRLVLLVLADHAREDGTGSWPAVETIGQEARLTRRQTQRCLRSLEANGSIRPEGKHSSGTQVYAVVMAVENSVETVDEGGDKMTPRGDIHDTEGATSTTAGVSQMSPEPSLEQPSLEPSRAETARAGGAALWKVDRQEVAPSEDSLARQVLAEWNQQSGQSLTSRDWLRQIVMRIREHPTLGIEEHAHVISTALADPWWTGPASPSVVYGNGAQFERSVSAATSPGPSRPRKLTPSEIAHQFDHLQGGGPDGATRDRPPRRPDRRDLPALEPGTGDD